MFIRKKQNKSGVVSVQVIDKSIGKYRMLKTIGSSAHGSEVERLVPVGKDWIKSQTGAQELDFTDYGHHTQLVLQGIEQVRFMDQLFYWVRFLMKWALGRSSPLCFEKTHCQLFRS